MIIASASGSHVESPAPTVPRTRASPVLIEKPLAPTSKVSMSLLDMAAKNMFLIVCGFVERFNAAFRATAEVLSEPPRHVMTMRHSPPALASGRVSCRISCFTTSTWFFNSCPALLSCKVQQVTARLSNGLTDIADCVLWFDRGIACLSANRAGQRKVRMLTAQTSNALIEVDLLRQNVTVYRNVSQEIIRRDGGVGYRSSTEIDIPFVRHVGEPLALQFEHFLWLLSGRGDHGPRVRGFAHRTS